MKNLVALGTVEIILVANEHDLATTFPVRGPCRNDDSVRFCSQNHFACTEGFIAKASVRVFQYCTHLNHARHFVSRSADPVDGPTGTFATAIGSEVNLLSDRQLTHVFKGNV